MVTEFDVVPTIIGILFLVLPALLLGRLCSHFKIPEIIGFVFAGIILGPTALGRRPTSSIPSRGIDDLPLFHQIL